MRWTKSAYAEALKIASQPGGGLEVRVEQLYTGAGDFRTMLAFVCDRAGVAHTAFVAGAADIGIAALYYKALYRDWAGGLDKRLALSGWWTGDQSKTTVSHGRAPTVRRNYDGSHANPGNHQPRAKGQNSAGLW